MSITDRDVRAQVTQTLDNASVGTSSTDFDVDGIVSELIAQYGLQGAYTDEQFWPVVHKHER